MSPATVKVGYSGLHAKYPIRLFDFNQMRNSSEDFREGPHYQI